MTIDDLNNCSKSELKNKLSIFINFFYKRIYLDRCQPSKCEILWKIHKSFLILNKKYTVYSILCCSIALKKILREINN